MSDRHLAIRQCLKREEEQVRLLRSARARHSAPPNGSRDPSPRVDAKFLPDSFQIRLNSVSRCFTFDVSPCLLALILLCRLYKIAIVPFTTLPMTNNLSFQGVLGWCPKVCGLSKISFVDSVVSL